MASGKMKKSIAYFFVIIATLCVVTTARADASTTSCEHLNERKAEWMSGGFYEGSFEDGTPFQMNLAFPMPASVVQDQMDVQDFLDPIDELQNQYWYPRHRGNDKLDLEIKALDESGIVLRTVSRGKDQTLSDSETFTGKRSKDWTEIEGKWTSDRSHKTMRFRMKMVFPYTSRLDIFMTQTSIDDFESERSMDIITYPAIENLGPEHLIPEWNPSPGDANANGHASYCDEQNHEIVTAEWASAHFLFFSNKIYEYRFGAAHGTRDRSFSHFSLSYGRYEQIALDTFYKTSLACENQLFDRVVAALVADHAAQLENVAQVFPDRHLLSDADIARGALTFDHISPDYLVLPEGIEFYVGPYVLGSYMDVHDIFIWKAQIENCIKTLPQYIPFGEGATSAKGGF
jgi:hypothetical protein